jgi:putative hydrolases of HD superfamily
MKVRETELDKLLGFMLTANNLKGTKRTGWVQGRVKNPEHVGDHSFTTALLSYLLAGKLGLDADRCMLMGLIHDLPEAIMGDIASKEDEADQVMSNAAKKKLENNSMLEILSVLDAETRNHLRGLWTELEENKSDEARLVKQVDKLDYVLLLAAYSKYLDDKAVDGFFATAGKAIDIPEIRYLFDKMKREVYSTRSK